jgi:hypothetical protein
VRNSAKKKLKKGIHAIPDNPYPFSFEFFEVLAAIRAESPTDRPGTVYHSMDWPIFCFRAREKNGHKPYRIRIA